MLLEERLLCKLKMKTLYLSEELGVLNKLDKENNKRINNNSRLKMMKIMWIVKQK
jgi:hypothetical protein